VRNGRVRHRSLIIHRDLKPSNILVTADGDPKLLDFGIAKILDAATDQTCTQERLLTPDYASPEQVRGAAQSTATDVYSLGVVLFRLLPGKSPHSFPTRTLEAIDAAICSTEPAPASRLNRSLPRDLDFILLKSLRKEPQARYSSVEAMADDVRAFLESQPIRARSGNAWYRTRKFVRRYRIAVAAAALISAALYLANRQRLIAQERFQQVHLLSGKVFDLDGRIKQLRGSTEARHELASISLDYLEQLSTSARGDLDLAQEIGAAYMRVARMQGVPTDSNLGDAAGAEANLAKADRWIDQVLESRKASAAAFILSDGIAQDRMVVADSQGRKSEAKIHSAKAIERLDQLFHLANLTPQQR
jgi:serine/threonine-protein kinase